MPLPASPTPDDTGEVGSQIDWDPEWDWRPPVDGGVRPTPMGAVFALVVALMVGGAVMTAVAVLDLMGIVVDGASAIGKFLPGG